MKSESEGGRERVREKRGEGRKGGWVREREGEREREREGREEGWRKGGSERASE